LFEIARYDEKNFFIFVFARSPENSSDERRITEKQLLESWKSSKKRGWKRGFTRRFTPSVEETGVFDAAGAHIERTRSPD